MEVYLSHPLGDSDDNDFIFVSESRMKLPRLSLQNYEHVIALSRQTYQTWRNVCDLPGGNPRRHVHHSAGVSSPLERRTALLWKAGIMGRRQRLISKSILNAIFRSSDKPSNRPHTILARILAFFSIFYLALSRYKAELSKSFATRYGVWIRMNTANHSGLRVGERSSGGRGLSVFWLCKSSSSSLSIQ